MQRMHLPVRFDGALRRDQRLADHLPAEHALPADLRAHAAIQVLLQRFQIEGVQEGFDGIGLWRSHCGSGNGGGAATRSMAPRHAIC